MIRRVQQWLIQLHTFKTWLIRISTFICLLVLYLPSALWEVSPLASKIPPRISAWVWWLWRPVSVPLIKLENWCRFYDKEFDRANLIDIALKNMLAKRSRALITVGGMSVGIGAIVFLVSLGYGANRLVVDRVARLEEMRQTEMTPKSGSSVKINDERLSQLKDLSDVEQVLPLIAVVAKVTFQNSASDMAVYGVTTDYLSQSAITPSYGTLFTSNSVSAHMNPGQTAQQPTQPPPVTTPKIGQPVQAVSFAIDDGNWVRVRNTFTQHSSIIGYTKRTEQPQHGIEVWGGTYDAESGKTVKDETGKWLGKWIKSQVPVWEKVSCGDDTPSTSDSTTNTSATTCADEYKPVVDESGTQQQIEGYLAQINMAVSANPDAMPMVLGESTEVASEARAGEISAVTGVGSSDANTKAEDDWVIVASVSGELNQVHHKRTLTMADDSVRQAVVNTAMLTILNLDPASAIGKEIEVSYIIVGDLLDKEEQVESAPTKYTIVGVVQEDKTPFFYVPFQDLRGLGIQNYSQVKVITSHPDSLSKVRVQIESMGFATQSVADTVAQIDQLFSTIRSVLALLGMVALSVAALGMFNTLTVSLLERTREVGLMKAMGMRSKEVSELFLTESMIMGFLGGVWGIFLGIAAGEILSFGISIVSLSQGQGYLDVAYVPLPFIAIIFLLSLIVGISTGIYPARRATKISALNALRYE